MTDTLKDRISVSDRGGEVQIVETAPGEYDIRFLTPGNRPLRAESMTEMARILKGVIRYMEYQSKS